MKKITRSALLPYPAETLYDLVNDVASYPDFLPWCGGSQVLETGDNEMVASVTIAKAGIKQTFTTRNELIPHSEVKMHLVDGPFSHLNGGWEFKALDESACKITFHIEFEVSNRLLNVAIGAIFEQIASTMVQSFCDRVKTVEG